MPRTSDTRSTTSNSRRALGSGSNSRRTLLPLTWQVGATRCERFKNLDSHLSLASIL
jgi:hypothetical protein